MEPTISASEFQRFQSQLLDLREAQILANEKRMRAEARVKQLENELTTALKTPRVSDSDQTQLKELINENKALRDKLQATESSFQLQSSTLQAECHSLATELSILHDLANKPRLTQMCQTDPSCWCLNAVTQTDVYLPIVIQPDPGTPQQLKDLRTALDVSNAVQDAYALSLFTLQNKVVELEERIHHEFAELQAHIAEITDERTGLETRVQQLSQLLADKEEANQLLRGELDGARKRSEKVNRELRRQLARFIRNQHSDSEHAALRKSPTFSSSSSLSSCLNGHPLSNCDSALGKCVTTSCAPDSAPSGFFPLEDFKALVGRMSEVQDENCMLRQQLQQQLNPQLALPNSRTIISQSHPTPVWPSSSNSVQSSATSGRSTSGLFSMLKLPGFTASSAVSSSEAVAVNRLKRMCEDLISQNIKLSDELEMLRGKR